MAVADASKAVLVPTIGTRSRLIMREVSPGGPVGAVVLAYRSPRALAQVRPPSLPVVAPLARLLETLFFGRHCSITLLSPRRIALFLEPLRLPKARLNPKTRACQLGAYTTSLDTTSPGSLARSRRHDSRRQRQCLCLLAGGLPCPQGRDGAPRSGDCLRRHRRDTRVVLG